MKIFSQRKGLITWPGLVQFAGMFSGQAWRNGLGQIQNVSSENEKKVYSNDELGGAFPPKIYL